MEYIKGLEKYHSTESSAVTLGKFDGVHRGHQKLIAQVQKLQKEHTVKSIVFAFDMTPLYVKKGLPRDGILSNEERRHFLETEVDCLVECPFDESISNMEAEDFVRDVLIGAFHAKYVVVGKDFRFGYKARGDIHMLEAYSKEYGYQLFALNKEMEDGREISSTLIREEIRLGNMQKAQQLLGYPYTVAGIIEHGAKLGRAMGFPTINVAPDKEKVLPPNGVYFVKALVDGVWHNGVANIGYKPTVSKEHRLLIETHLLNFSEDVYGKSAIIQLLEFERPEQKFGSVEELRARLMLDIALGKEYFGI